MSTTSGTMKSFRVTDPEGNVYIMIPVDTTARTAAANASALATSLNVDSVKYKNIVSDPNLNSYNPESTYAVGNFCYYENELYECNTDISTAEAWNAAHWTKIIVKDLIDAAKAVADEAAQAIEGAKDLTFDENFFTPDETDTEVNIKLNGVPFGVDDETPLQILQDTQEGLVLGADSPFNSAIAPPFDGTIAYKVGDHVTYKSKLYKCTTAIVTPSSTWDPSNWTETSVDEETKQLPNMCIIDPDEITDWIDITNEWEFVNEFNLTPVSDQPNNSMTIKYSPKYNLVKFFGECRITRSSGWNDTDWKIFLRYVGDRFYTSYNCPNIKDAPYIYPIVPFIQFMSGLSGTGSSNTILVRVWYVGSPYASLESSGLAMKQNINISNNYGSAIGNLVLKVTPKN